MTIKRIKKHLFIYFMDYRLRQKSNDSVVRTAQKTAPENHLLNTPFRKKAGKCLQNRE